MVSLGDGKVGAVLAFAFELLCLTGVLHVCSCGRGPPGVGWRSKVATVNVVGTVGNGPLITAGGASASVSSNVFSCMASRLIFFRWKMSAMGRCVEANREK